MNRIEFLQDRQSGIGSSDVAKILGISRWGTALDVYLEKTQPVDDQAKMPPQLEWGIRKEPAVAGAVCDLLRCELIKPKARRHAQHPWLLANPDRENDSAELIEIKNSDSYDSWGPSDSNVFPDEYWIQIQHQLAVFHSTDPVYERCWLFVLIGHCDFRKYLVERDPGYLDTVYEPLREFWDCVENRRPPEPDWTHPQTLAAVQKLHNPDAEKSIQLDDNFDLMSLEYQRLSESISELTKQREEIKSRLIHAMGDSGTAELNSGRRLTRAIVNRKGYTVEPCTYVDFRVKNPKGMK